MIYGIGVDVVEPGRIARLIERFGDRFVRRILSPLERPGYSHSSRPALYLANRFAAKEAFSKAMGTGLRDPVTLQNVSVVSDAMGKPGFAFHPRLAETVTGRGITRHHLSITHEKSVACAFVVLETGERAS
jgi:holo-[acyl-carrier protein] synthase